MHAEVSLPELLEEPHQPVLNFPWPEETCVLQLTGQDGGLAAKWFWLHNDEVQDAVFCFRPSLVCYLFPVPICSAKTGGDY